MMQSVSKLISDKYGLQAEAGKKGECPHCGHNTLSFHHLDQQMVRLEDLK